MRRCGEPCDERCKFFVLRPGWAERAAQHGDTLREVRRSTAQSARSKIGQFTLSNHHRLESGARGGMQQRFAKQLAVSSVNQRMGGENFCKSWKRPSRSKEETKTRERISLVAKFSFQLTDCAKGEPSRPRSDSRDESAGFLSRQLFCCVVWLAKFIRKVLDEMKALANQHDWRAFRHCEGYQRGPAGVNAK